VALGGLLDSKNMILVGDLNYTTGVDKVWGVVVELDKLADYFKCMFLDHHLINLLQNEIVPTWRNNRSGLDSISKCLD